MGNLAQVITKFLFLWSQLGKGRALVSLELALLPVLESFPTIETVSFHLMQRRSIHHRDT